MLTGITNFIFGSTTAEVEKEQVELRTSSADNEWVLVDKDSPRLHRHGIKKSSKENSPTHFVHVKNRSLDESWLVTPPSCFTAGNNPDMSSSPLENLLIEHPSMSVYGPCQQQRTGSVETEQSSEEEEMRIAQVPQHRSRAVTAKATLKLRYQTTKSMQIVMRKHNTRSLTRSKMERQNKVHLAHGHKQHKKRDHIVQPSSRSFANKKF